MARQVHFNMPLGWDFSKCWACQARLRRPTPQSMAMPLQPQRERRFAHTKLKAARSRPEHDRRREWVQDSPSSRQQSFSQNNIRDIVREAKKEDNRQSRAVKEKTSKAKTKTVRRSLKKWLEENPAALTVVSSPMAATPGSSTAGISEGSEFGNNDATVDDDENFYLAKYDRLAAPSEGVAEDHIMEPGDLVELSNNRSEDNFAVYLMTYKDFSWYYTMNGRLGFQARRSTYFRLPSYFPRDQLTPLVQLLTPEFMDRFISASEPGVNSQSISRAIGSHIRKELTDFQHRAHGFFRKYSSTLVNIYPLISDWEKLKYIELQKLADLVIERDPAGDKRDRDDGAFLCAVNTAALRMNPGVHLNGRINPQSRWLLVDSVRAMQAVAHVRNWLRSYFEDGAHEEGAGRSKANTAAVFNFIETARRLVTLSRSIRNISDDGNFITTKNLDADTIARLNNTKESAPIHLAHTFTEDENKFILFLTRCAEMDAFVRHREDASLMPSLIRALNVYPADIEVGKPLVHRLLVEMGVMQPFDCSLPVDSLVHMSGLELGVRGKSVDLLPKEPIVELTDSMEHVRHDWGNLPVYVVDNAASTNADDGISVEPVPDEPGKVWLRNHIAHVSAFIPPKSTLADLAEGRMWTCYFPETVIPMLPQRVTEKTKVQAGAAVFTHSMKINLETGQVEDYNARAGRVHNIVRMTTEDVDVGIYNEQGQESSIFRRWRTGEWDRPPGDNRLHPELSEQTRSDWKLLLETCRALRKASSASFFNDNPTEANIQVQQDQKGRTGAFRAQQYAFKARYLLRDPRTEYSISRQTQGELTFDTVISKAGFIVQVVMSEACVQGAQWAAHRNLPLAYIGTRAAVDITTEEREHMRRQFELIGKGLLPADDAKVLYHTARRWYGTRRVASVPIEQRFMGIKAYAKLTSPLRRYLDLLCMWQLDAAVLEETKQGSLVGQHGDEFLPFSRAEMDTKIERHERNMLMARRFESAHEKHWTLVAMGQALYNGWNGGLHRMRAHVVQATARSDSHLQTWNDAQLSLPELADMVTSTVTSPVGSEDGREICKGETWEVEVAAVELHNRIMAVRPLRRLAAAQGALETEANSGVTLEATSTS